METHSSPLAWKIAWTEEPGGLQFTGSQRVGHDSNVTVSLSVLPSQQRDVLELLTFPGDAVVESACQLRRHKRLDT